MSQYPTQEQRERFEEAVKEDLSKSYRHLLRDVHEELEHPTRSAQENVMHGWKRMASLFVRMGEKFEASQNQLMLLTWIVTFVALLQIVLQLFPNTRATVALAVERVWSGDLVVLGLVATLGGTVFLWNGLRDLPPRGRRITRIGLVLLGVGFLLQLIARLR